jgi:formylglycine-generating enzyme required for sulfatase activity
MIGPLLTRIGVERLKAIGAELNVPLPNTKFPGELASILRDHFDDPRVISPHLSAEDLRAIGESYVFETKEKWQAENVGEDFDAMVRELVFQQADVVEPKIRTESKRNIDHVDDWPELRSFAAWKKVRFVTRFSYELAKALGKKSFVQAPAEKSLGLARVRHRKSGITFVAIPGGKFQMGLSPAEKKKLGTLASKLGEEARLHVQSMSGCAAPVHNVTLPPFLCSESPMTAKQVKRAGWKSSIETLPIHDVVLAENKDAAGIIERVGGRLLTESEWEYIARAGEQRLWLSDATAPGEFVTDFMAGTLLADAPAFGIHGLCWGTWVDDAWASSYRKAPKDGSAFEPHELPEVVRGGGAPRSYPWQVGGERLLLVTAHRERSEKGRFPILVARNLPKR